MNTDDVFEDMYLNREDCCYENLLHCVFGYLVKCSFLSQCTFLIKNWTDEKCEGVGSSEDDQDNSGGETELPEIDPRAEDRELKNHLLRKYSGYLSSLKQELSKKKKKGKLPKEARQKLLSWWELHYKWPYPSVRICISSLKFNSWLSTTCYGMLLEFPLDF